jgi:hypothetical protein
MADPWIFFMSETPSEGFPSLLSPARMIRSGMLPDPVGIATPRRVDHLGSNAGDLDALTPGVDVRPVATERDDQCLDLAGERLEGVSGTVLQQLRFVIVDGHVGCRVDESHQVGAVEHRQPLAGIEDERDAGLRELPGVLDHAVASVRRNDPELRTCRVVDVVEVRVVHRAGMEGGDLVVVQVGGDEGLRGEAVGDLAHMRARQPERIEAGQVGRGVVADGRHDGRFGTQHFQRVRDVAGAPAELAPHVWHEESHVQDLDLLGQDMVLEPVMEHHDGVEGDRAADERGHVCCGSEEGVRSWHRRRVGDAARAACGSSGRPSIASRHRGPAGPWALPGSRLRARASATMYVPIPGHRARS